MQNQAIAVPSGEESKDKPTRAKTIPATIIRIRIVVCSRVTISKYFRKAISLSLCLGLLSMSVLLSMAKIMEDAEEVSLGKGDMPKHEAHFPGVNLSICSLSQELIDGWGRDAKSVAGVVVMLDHREKELVMGLPVLQVDGRSQIALNLPDRGKHEGPWPPPS